MKTRNSVLAVLVAIAVALPANAAHATDLTAHLTVDDYFSYYISTDDAVAGDLIGTGDYWGNTYNFDTELTPGVTQFIHVIGGNGGGPASLLGQFDLSDSNFAFEDGSQQILTETSDWLVSPTGFGTDYVIPTNWGANGVDPWGTRPDISTGSHWIWTNDFGAIRYFTAVMRPTVPEPANVLLICFAAVGILFLTGRPVRCDDRPPQRTPQILRGRILYLPQRRHRRSCVAGEASP